MRPITQDDSSRQTNPASVGWSATLLQIYRCEGCGRGWRKSKMSRCFCRFLALSMQRCICRWAECRDSDVCRTEWLDPDRWKCRHPCSRWYERVFRDSYHLGSCCVFRNMQMVSVYNSKVNATSYRHDTSQMAQSRFRM